MIAALVIGGVLLLAMIGVAWYGWVTLPADALVPIHFGTGAARPPHEKGLPLRRRRVHRRPWPRGSYPRRPGCGA
jgi:hypothetical protein